MLDSFKFYRRWIGKSWYLYRSTGQLPGLFGCWWTRERWPEHRYYYLVREEHHQ